MWTKHKKSSIPEIRKCILDATEFRIVVEDVPGDVSLAEMISASENELSYQDCGESGQYKGMNWYVFTSPNGETNLYY